MQITQNDAGLPTVSTKYPVPRYRPVVTSMAGKAMSGPPVKGPHQFIFDASIRDFPGLSLLLRDGFVFVVSEFPRNAYVLTPMMHQYLLVRTLATGRVSSRYKQAATPTVA